MRHLRPTWISPGRVNNPVWSCTGRGLPGRRVTATPVRSYRTFSPLPVRNSRVAAPSAVYFCGTVPRVSPGGRYPPSYHLVSGLSSKGFLSLRSRPTHKGQCRAPHQSDGNFPPPGHQRPVSSRERPRSRSTNRIQAKYSPGS